MFKAMTAHHFF